MQIPAQAKQSLPGTGAVDVDKIIAEARKGVPGNLQPVFDKIVLSGMRIMFDKSSFQMTLDTLNKPGPLEKRLAEGIIALMYMLWQQSNRTMPPQLVVPATLVLTLRAFQFLQLSQDPEATKEALGAAIEQAISGIVERFKPTTGSAPAQPGAAAKPQGGGMLASAMGGKNV